jgi:hypothetical protein
VTQPRVEGTVTIEEARILFKNFEGRESQYNRAGSKNFCVVLDEKTAEDLIRDGWTGVRRLKPRNDDEPGDWVMQVTVSYKNKPARVIMITSRGRTELDEETIELLDDLEFKTVDMIISPYNWNVRGETGVSAYLRKMFVTIEEDYLDLKYAEAVATDEEIAESITLRTAF